MFGWGTTEIGTLSGAKNAKNEFQSMVNLEIKSRRLRKDESEEEDPVSNRIMKDLEFVIGGLANLQSRSKTTGQEYLDFTKDVRSRHEAARSVSIFRIENEEIFVFAISGILPRNFNDTIWESINSSLKTIKNKRYWPIEESQSSKDVIHQRSKDLHQIAKQVATMLSQYKFGKQYNHEYPTFASTESGALVLKLIGPLTETLRAFSVCYRAGESFEKVLMRSSETVSHFKRTMEIPFFNGNEMAFQVEMDWGLRVIDKWQNALQIFINRISKALERRRDLSKSNGDNYSEDLTFFSRILNNKSTSASSLITVSDIQLTYKLITPVIREMSNPSIPILFDGKQSDIKDLWDDGDGSFARVKKYKLPAQRTFPVQYGVCSTSWTIDEIAVKQLVMPSGISLIEAEKRNSVRILRELNVWSKMKHENIVPLLGVWLDFTRFTGDIPSPCPVAPFIHGGTLDLYLDNNPDLSQSDRLSIMLGIISALDYMHNHEYAEAVHGDLKPNNILIKDGKPYLCDFGCSHLMDDIAGLSTDVHSNSVWCAPERIRHDIVGGRQMKPTCAGDMYSFGLVFLSTVNNIPPFEQHGYGQDIDYLRGKRVEDDLFPVEIAHISAEQQTLLKGCWETEPLLRITAHLALEELKTFGI